MSKIFTAIDRYSRWILLVLMLLFILTGLGITKNIMDQRLAKQLHENILPLPFYLLFLVHIFYKLPVHLVRWRVFKSEATAALYVYALAAILLGLFLWIHFR
jgi:cytochrome b subunit of formate dehydrogenase